jgi:hypothetical protein
MAQAQLGIRYRTGSGVPQDFVEASDVFEFEKEAGHV